MLSPSVDNLVAQLTRLPGIGTRTAQRLAFHLLSVPSDEALALAEAIREMKERVRFCRDCGNLTEDELCRAGGLPDAETLKGHYYSARDLRGMYPVLRDDHLRYLAKCGLSVCVLEERTECGGACETQEPIPGVRLVGDWLPDGSGLLYSTNRTGRFEIWTETFREHNTRAIVTPDAFPEGPSFFLVHFHTYSVVTLGPR